MTKTRKPRKFPTERKGYQTGSMRGLSTICRNCGEVAGTHYYLSPYNCPVLNSHEFKDEAWA